MKKAQQGRPITGSSQNPADNNIMDSSQAQSTQSMSGVKDSMTTNGGTSTKSNTQTSMQSTPAGNGSGNGIGSGGTQERVLITGDDILIEYVERLMTEIKTVNDNDLKVSWKNQIEKFITHYVWHSQDPVANDKIKHG